MKEERKVGGMLERLWPAALAAAILAIALVAGACGGDDSPSASSRDAAERPAVKRAVRALQRSFLAGDRRALCNRMDATARHQAGLVAHGKPEACPKDLAEAFEVIDSGGGMRGVRRATVGATTVTGSDATAAVAFGDQRVDVPLTKGQGAWRLGTFFGTPPRKATAVVADLRAPFPSTRRPVTATDGGGLECFPLFRAGDVQTAGSCPVGATGHRIKLTIATAFGSFEFGECEIGYSLAVDGKGRTWTESFLSSGPDNLNNGCADVEACESASGTPLPWKGRVSATGDGDYLHRMAVCLDTCIGFYAGPLITRLSKSPDGWRATASNAAVGESGFSFDGQFELVAPDGVKLKPARG